LSFKIEHMVVDVNGDGSIRSVYVYGEKAHVPSYMIRGGEKFAFVSDERGSVRMVVAMGSGSVVQELRYDVWGRVAFDSNPGFQPFGYAGGIFDEATGLVRFGARDYDGEIGRWLGKDPVGFNGGQTNLYAYVKNDPINIIDSSGEVGSAAQIAVGIAISAGVFCAIDQGIGGGNDLEITSPLDKINELTKELNNGQCPQKRKGEIRREIEKLRHQGIMSIGAAARRENKSQADSTGKEIICDIFGSKK
jgi:RHS repeat-associated protein